MRDQKLYSYKKINVSAVCVVTLWHRTFLNARMPSTFFFFKNLHAVLQTFVIALEVAEKHGFSDKARTLEIDDEKLLKISPEKNQGPI